MKTILVPTDFSERSDRAIRRAVLLARQTGATLSLVHVVDDDRPAPLVATACDAAGTLLDDQARTLRQSDGIECTAQVVAADPFAGIALAAEQTAADLIVIGPHRRHLLEDVFTGTTAERTIRASRVPVLMANGVPSAGYAQALLAVDLSDCAAGAVNSVTALGLCQARSTAALYVFDAPGTGLVAGGSLSAGRAQDYLREEADHARKALAGFLARLPGVASELLVKPGATSPARVILETAREISADLLILATHGRTGASRLLLGSVADEVLRAADRDVLAVPCRGPA